MVPSSLFSAFLSIDLRIKRDMATASKPDKKLNISLLSISISLNIKLPRKIPPTKNINGIIYKIKVYFNRFETSALTSTRSPTLASKLLATITVCATTSQLLLHSLHLLAQPEARLNSNSILSSSIFLTKPILSI